jgi:hypothetical protein
VRTQWQTGLKNNFERNINIFKANLYCNSDWRINQMDKMGLGMLIIGILLVIGGAYGIWYFLPDVIDVIKGAIGIVALLAGIMLAGIGFILVKD